MAELQLTLTNDEHDYLVNLLESTLKKTRIEEHRTRTPMAASRCSSKSIWSSAIG